ncbi:MAG: DUF5110 domain-containing protein [Flavobacterium sp.]|nr:MAG: DUF5110 domain-containing protein [Flavobacterium sp.]
MKGLFMFLLLISSLQAFTQRYQDHVLEKDRVIINLDEGKLAIIPLAAKAVRIQFSKTLLPEKQDFVFLKNNIKVPFKISETRKNLTMTTGGMKVVFDKVSGHLQYIDPSNQVFLKEIAGSKRLTENTVSGEKCYIAMQHFDSPDNESLFGLGQFQDGQYNLKNIPRQLIQVNTQIAIPFLYSSRGYGILWNQYGLTDFNPADQEIKLGRQSSGTGERNEVEVTTTAGTQKVSQQEAVYTGTMQVPLSGKYAFMLNLGAMESRHLLLIDGKPYIDQANLWLPPAAGTLIDLDSGTHQIQVICKNKNIPKLTFKPSANETVFRSPHAKSLDYVVFAGNNADEVIAGYRNLTGNVPMLPLWAFGFWQCRERYTSGAHLVNTVAEFRKRNLPVDVIVQDWQYWGKYGWGVPKFDETNYPDPKGFIKNLHDLHARFSISVWENIDQKSEVAKPYLAKNLYIPNSPWIDIFNPETQKLHWDVLDTNLFNKGVDSWWMDATEPENDALVGKNTYFGPGDFYRLVYPFFVSRAVYQGQRNSNHGKRVVTLTRSAFAGQQRFGTINWSGDIGWNWDTYKRQIVAGLNYSLTGMPYWTTDIGGFFRPGKGQYTDVKYHEILTRWFEWGAFNPIFRIHGYQSETEPWKYGPVVEENMRHILDLRYRLLPYIYTEAWKISHEGATMMRPLVMDFNKDTAAISTREEYMFGKSFLVAPVTEPGVTTWKVYLPKAAGWYNFWTGQFHQGGKHLDTPSPLGKIPLFVKAGSIIPMGKPMQYTQEKDLDSLEIRVYEGQDARFELYEDEGDNYGYEKGKHSIIPFFWNERKRYLEIGGQIGKYPGSLIKRTFKVVFFSKDAQAKRRGEVTTTVYQGKKLIIK